MIQDTLTSSCISICAYAMVYTACLTALLFPSGSSEQREGTAAEGHQKSGELGQDGARWMRIGSSKGYGTV
jgi:hypothetical protein